MKKIFTLCFLAAAFAAPVRAQTFISEQSASGDSASANGADLFNVYNKLKSTAGPVVVEWRVVDHSANVSDAATEWGVDGLCDNVTCYAGGAPLLSGLPQISDPYTDSFFGTFYLIFNATSAPANSMAWVRVAVRDTSAGGTNRMLTFIGTKSATGVVRVSVSEQALNLFPNPAGRTLTVALTDGQTIGAVAVYGADGRQVLRQQGRGQTANVLLEGLPAGLYFVRVHDAEGRAIAARRFMHQ